MLKLVIDNKRYGDADNITSVWESLSGMLSIFVETIVSKTYNKSVVKDAKTKNLVKISEL